MADEVFLARSHDIPKGEGRNFDVEGRTVAVFHTQAGEIYATQPHCPHRQGPLADGLMGGATIVCPLHDRVFDLKTGCGLSHENLTIKTYPLRVSDAGEIYFALASLADAETELVKVA